MAPTLKEGYKHILTVDDREPIEFLELVAKNCTIPLDIKRLKTCDYICEDVGIERKTIDDFISSMVSSKKRLWKQCERMHKQFRFPYLIISGHFSDRHSAVSMHSILGSLAFIATPRTSGNTVIQPGITVITVETPQELAYLVLKIMQRHHKIEVLEDVKDI